MCTEFFLITKENNLISGRTFDFPFNPTYQIEQVKKNDQIFLYDINNKYIYYNDNKYNYIFLYCFNNKNMISDGMNEEGLIINILWQADTIYAKTDNILNPVFFLDIPKLILSQCKNITEIKELLKNKQIWNKELPLNNENENIIGKLHYSVHDKNHNSIIIEIENGIPNFIENELQVMTNQPNYYWHEKNIDNYLHLSNKTISNINSKKNIHTDVNGNCLVGIPGDFTSISRFIKTHKLISFLPEKYNDSETISIVDKILGNATIPIYGIIENSKTNNQLMLHSYYSIIKNQNTLEWYIKKDSDINYTTYKMRNN